MRDTRLERVPLRRKQLRVVHNRQQRKDEPIPSRPTQNSDFTRLGERECGISENLKYGARDGESLFAIEERVRGRIGGSEEGLFFGAVGRRAWVSAAVERDETEAGGRGEGIDRIEAR